ncbi:hypothetical protein [Pseudomonas eucalypticola]|uniref:DUF2142 domain-containing protein n=1 Tax=Pseudomonas eucalypticola TaxID=2599595 RepID=A0A7D5D9G1_9PSED|nr:hypothetical protein [Pseudomonas eucalypticola]QKZ06178.1 hypothetical protein HWQ56_21320 [Pseudomonas eucalypticola]
MRKDHYPLIKDRPVRLTLASAFVALVVLWSLTIAFHGAPDESTHFFLLDYLYTNHHFPLHTVIDQPFHGTVSLHTWAPGDFWYHGLPFPHVLGGLVTTYVGSFILPQNLLYLGARAFNWLLAGLFFSAIYRIGTSQNLGTKRAALIAGIICLIPQVTFIFAYFNSDAYGITVIALALAALLEYKATPTLKTALAAGFFIGLTCLAKIYFLPSLVFFAVTLTLQTVCVKPSRTRLLALILLTAFVTCLPMLAYTYHLFGEVSGVSGQAEFVNMHRESAAAAGGTCYLMCKNGLVDLHTLIPWLTTSAKSYFSLTGWMSIALSQTHYIIALAAMTGLVLATLFLLIRKPANFALKDFNLNFAIPSIMILGLFPAIVLFSIIGSQLAMPQPQGRYLFVTIPFLGYLIAMLVSTHPLTHYQAGKTQ